MLCLTAVLLLLVSLLVSLPQDSGWMRFILLILSIYLSLFQKEISPQYSEHLRKQEHYSSNCIRLSFRTNCSP